jgi:MFS transporter, AAHS family, 4-hydroxybenzoate transporter
MMLNRSLPRENESAGSTRSGYAAQIQPSARDNDVENEPLGTVQVRVAVICALIQMCEGYDIGSIGWAVPSLTHAWQLPPSAFSLAFLWSNLGMIAGAVMSGPIGDRFGRKPLLLVSLGLFGLASLASAASASIAFLAATRFFTGMGIAGGFSGATALTGDYAPQRLRATMIMVAVTGAPFGGFVGGQLAALLLGQGYDWPVIFIAGGVFPLVLLLITALWLPESPRFMSARATTRAVRGLAFPGEKAIRMLFGDGYALQTFLLWIIFFCSLLDLYLFVFWLPEILHLIGLTPAEAVFATSLQTLGGVFAVLYLGWAIDRFGTRSLALHYGAGIVFIGLIALAALPYSALLVAVFLSGVTVIGSQTGLNAACGKLYPARMRATGYGFASGVGRLGGIAAAPLRGYLLAHGLPPPFVFLSACVFAPIAAAATALLGLPGSRPSRGSSGNPINVTERN